MPTSIALMLHEVEETMNSPPYETVPDTRVTRLYRYETLLKTRVHAERNASLPILRLSKVAGIVSHAFTR